MFQQRLFRAGGGLWWDTIEIHCETRYVNDFASWYLRIQRLSKWCIYEPHHFSYGYLSGPMGLSMISCIAPSSPCHVLSGVCGMEFQLSIFNHRMVKMSLPLFLLLAAAFYLLMPHQACCSPIYISPSGASVSLLLIVLQAD